MIGHTPLRKPKVIDIIHHFRQQPVLRRISRSIDQIRANIRANRQRQEIPRRLIDVKVSIARGGELAVGSQRSLVAVVGIEQPACREELLKGRAADVLRDGLRDLEVEAIAARVQSPNLVRTG